VKYKIVKNITIYSILTIFAIIMVFPFLWMIINSFNTEQNIFRIPPSFIPDKLFKPDMFDNYSTVLSEYHFLRYTLNSLFVSFSAAFGQILTCSLAGFAFARMEFKGKNILFGLLLGTMMVPLQVTIIPEFLLMMKLGWLDTYLPLIVPSFLVGSFGTFLLREFYENIPKDLEDAAVIDGAGPFKLYWYVFLPLGKTPIATLFIIAFMNNWNALLRPILYISDDKLMTLPMALTQFQSQYGARWNLLLTGSFLAVIPLFIIYLFMQKYMVEGITHTGLKG
jgi:multiple sugar transport system permease protein